MVHKPRVPSSGPQCENNKHMKSYILICKSHLSISRTPSQTMKKSATYSPENTVHLHLILSMQITCYIKKIVNCGKSLVLVEQNQQQQL